MTTQKTIFMTREQWEKWDTALRSGKYKQTKGVLHNTNNGGFCCLGVMQHCLTGWVEDRTLPSTDWLDKHEIKFYDGLFGNNVPLLTEHNTASTLNDDGMSFIEIADLIKQRVVFPDGTSP